MTKILCDLVLVQSELVLIDNIIKTWHIFFRNDFYRSVSTLLFGTLLAQIIPFLANFILARQFSPSAFGIYSIFSSTVAIFSIVSTGRYELAIIMPKQDRYSFALTKLTLLICLISSISILIFLLLFSTMIRDITSLKLLSFWVFLIPVSSFFAASCLTINSWLLRQKQYRLLARNRVFQALIIALMSVIGGFLGGHFAFLIFANLIGTAVLFFILFNHVKNYKVDLNIRKRLVLLRMYSNYPKFLLLGQLFNSLSLQLPVFLLAYYFDSAIVGHFSFCYRILVIPSALLGYSIGEVYRQKSAAQFLLTGECRDLFLSTIKKLLIVALPPMLALFFLGKPLFQFLFGVQWGTAGEIAQIMSVMMFFQLISSPTSLTLLLANHHHIDLAWQILRMLLSLVAFFFGKEQQSFHLALILYTVCMSTLYCIHSLLQYRAATGCPRKRLGTQQR